MTETPEQKQNIPIFDYKYTVFFFYSKAFPYEKDVQFNKNMDQFLFLHIVSKRDR